MIRLRLTQTCVRLSIDIVFSRSCGCWAQLVRQASFMVRRVGWVGRTRETAAGGRHAGHELPQASLRAAQRTGYCRIGSWGGARRVRVGVCARPSVRRHRLRPQPLHAPATQRQQSLALQELRGSMACRARQTLGDCTPSEVALINISRNHKYLTLTLLT